MLPDRQIIMRQTVNAPWHKQSTDQTGSQDGHHRVTVATAEQETAAQF